MGILGVVPRLKRRHHPRPDRSVVSGSQALQPASPSLTLANTTSSSAISTIPLIQIFQTVQMLCDTCSKIPYDLFIRAGTFRHGTLHQVRQSAKAGCGFCELIDDSFELQNRRGKVRILGNVINEYVVLAHSAWLPTLDLLYKDDISQTDGAPLWFDVLIGSEGRFTDDEAECANMN
jgi:hypothetical protein